MKATDPDLARPDPAGAATRPPSSKAAYGGLDVLRLVSCLAVVVYHFTFRGSTHDHFTYFGMPGLHFATKYGYFGVELFFIISGFVITCSTFGRDPADFLVSRFVRIYPGFLCCMSSTFAVLLLFGAPAFQVTWQQWFANLFIVAPALKQPFVDGVYWSLVCEMIFYAWVFGLKLFDVFDRHVTAIAAIWSALSAMDLLVLHSPLVSALMLTKYSGFFCAGMLIHQYQVRKNVSAGIVLLILVMPVAVAQGVDDINYHRIYYAGTSFSALVGTAACLGMIAAVALTVARPRRGPRRSLTLLAGGVTYPMYLLHQNIGYLILNRFAGSIPARYLLAGTVSALLLLAIAVWHFVEKPGQRLARTWLRSLLARVTLSTARLRGAGHT